MNRAQLSLLLVALLLGIPRLALSQASINKADVVGSWVLESQRSLKTGVVDSVAKHRTAWVYFSPTRVFYVSQENNRPTVSAADFAKMTLAEKLASRLTPEQERPPHERLSDREYRVMWLLASGKTLHQIGRASCRERV